MMSIIIDVLNHYPTIARGLVMLMHGKFKKAVEDMKTNERLVYNLVKKYVSQKPIEPFTSINTNKTHRSEDGPQRFLN